MKKTIFTAIFILSAAAALAEVAALPAVTASPAAATVAATSNISITPAATQTIAVIAAIVSGTAVGIDEAIIKGINSSAEIQQALAGISAAKAEVEREKGIFDLNLNGSVKYSELTRESLAIQMPEQEKLMSYSAGLSNRIFTGGELSLNFVSSREYLLFPPYSGSIDASLFRPAINPYYNPMLALVYRQPLLKDFWGSPGDKKVKAADCREKAAQEDLKEAVLNQACALKKAYYLVYLRDINVKARKIYISAVEGVYTRLAAAGAGEADLLAAKAAAVQARAAMTGLENSLKDAKERYLNLAGFAPSEWDAITVEPQENTDNVYLPDAMDEDLEATLVDVQPKVTAMKFLLDAAELEKAMAENIWLPAFNLTGSYGLSGSAGSIDGAFGNMGAHKDFMVGADFSWSLPGRQGSGAAGAGRANHKKAIAALDGIKTEYRIKLRKAYGGVAAGKTYYGAARDARLMLERRARIMKGAQARDLLPAHFDRYNARISEAEALAAYAEAIVEWNRLNGKYDFYYNDYMKSVQERLK